MTPRPVAVRLRAEEGFTLIEMLVCMVLGVVLLGATLAIIDVSLHETSRVNDRVESAQLGRTAMQKVVQELHSSCVAGSVVPVQAGSDANNLLFLSAFSSQTTVTPSLHKVSYSAGALIDTTYPVASGAAPTWTFSATPSATIQLLGPGSGAASPTFTGSPAVAQPIFQYFSYVNGALSTTPLATPLSAASAATVAEVTINFAAGPSSGNQAPDRTTAFSNSVVMRLSPPSNDPTVADAPCA